MFQKLFAVISLSALLMQPVQASASQASNGASEASVLTGSLVVYGTSKLLEASSELVVESVKAVGEGAVVVLKGSGEAASVAVKISGKVAEDASLAAGQVIKVITLSTGYLLEKAGQVIAFIPNEVGKALTTAKD
ncbi:hypothetical protein GUA87_12245 [Sneathiella sp. P13V-1]|uniref:hypothetical protein n=1 Tax=Sneathiella sp. P13V-1 TaxID=2697366 RepID=UPI00187B8D72|nr:hypothetical protein [Sneathiella sp. P13V-1]MBE7637617.1 hypothetical protein [Sneathiella sp. P13V-1]